jgi:hypothetical protein
MQYTGKKEPLLDFLRELCMEMMATHGSSPSKYVITVFALYFFSHDIVLYRQNLPVFYLKVYFYDTVGKGEPARSPPTLGSTRWTIGLSRRSSTRRASHPGATASSAHWRASPT